MTIKAIKYQVSVNNRNIKQVETMQMLNEDKGNKYHTWKY